MTYIFQTAFKIFSLPVLFLASLCLIFFQTSAPTINNDSEEILELPIIMYHSVFKGNGKLSKFVISDKELEGDLKYLTANNYHTIFINELIDYVYSERTLPENPIILTFDDGYYNNYLYAYPLMKQYNCKMVISPIGKCIDIYSKSTDRNPYYAHVTWDNLKEMQNSGLVEVQNHSYNIHTNSGKRFGTKIKKGESKHEYKKALIEDIEGFQEKLNANLNISPTTFTYPFGAISNCSLDILKEMGFKATLSCENKMNKISHDPECLYGLFRFIRPTGISSEKFFQTKVESQFSSQ